MANDVILYSAIAKKLDSVLSGGKIAKINQPSEYEVVFSVLKNGREYPLTICCNGELSRIEISRSLGENPISAPAFTMLLRKYLKNARIESVELFNHDRIILITLRSKNELRDNTLFRLYYEGMGRYSNIVLTDGNDVILDCIKRVGIGMSDRVLLPGIAYPLQQHVKTPLADWQKVCDIVDNVAMATDISAKISGISKDTAEEIWASKDKKGRLAELIAANGDHGYIYLYKGKAVLTPTPYYTMGEPIATFDNILDGMSYLYKQRAEESSKKESTKEHQKLIKALVARYQRMQKGAQAILDNVATYETYRSYGELILCSGYMLNRGASTLNTTDYVTMQEVSIPLDPLKSAKENAEAYFRKYKKGKKAIEVSTEQVETAAKMLEYLAQIAAHVSLCNTKAELEEILQELRKIAGKRAEKTKKTPKQPKPSPITTIDYQGYRILVGKNNQQNDRLTFDIAKGGDVWLHVKDFHGSHVIIVTENRPVPDGVIKAAAELAAYYSTARDADKVDVDYTERKNVKRQGSLLGMVVYKNYKTITVKPCSEAC